MADSDDLFRLVLQRFGLGAMPSSRARLGADLKAALLAEIAPERARLVNDTLPATARGIQIITEIEERIRQAREEKKQVAQGNATASGSATASEAMSAPANPPPNPDEVRARDIMMGEARARFDQACASEIGFAERWVHFWSNHFCVALRRGRIMNGITGAFEREAIRAHAFGRFEDMLVAVETHPAMLHYLDQRQSTGPNSPAGRRRQKGLNENLAREILELHTLGVSGGYAQADVTEFAKILTGWSITNFEENIDGYGGFFFAPNRHEPGSQTVLGKSYGQTGQQKGLAVLRDLAHHPATGMFVAKKLARHFVADDPPVALVNRLATEFRKTHGDLAALARALVSAPEAWSAPFTKLRSPYELIVATLRATGEKPERMPALMNALNVMGQPLWNPAGPNGHQDDSMTLLAPKQMKTRLEYAGQTARQIGGRIDPRELAGQLYGSALSTETRTAIARAETRQQGLALLLMSPEFQRR